MMKVFAEKFAKKLVERNYTKRVLAILIAAGILLIATAILIPTTLHKQISEFRALEEEKELQEKNDTAAVTPEGSAEGKETREQDGKEQEIKAILRQLSPVGVGIKIVFAAVALLAFLLGAFYWITMAEWLYKTAVLHRLNRALWPMLGLIGNLLVLPVLLIVLCDPKRAGKQVP